MSAADRLDEASEAERPDGAPRGVPFKHWHWWSVGSRLPCWCGHGGLIHARPPTGCEMCACQAYSPRGASAEDRLAGSGDSDFARALEAAVGTVWDAVEAFFNAVGPGASR